SHLERLLHHSRVCAAETLGAALGRVARALALRESRRLDAGAFELPPRRAEPEARMVSSRAHVPSAPRLSLLLVVTLVLVACFAACQRAENPRFPHTVHLTELACGGPGQPECLSCASCHAPSQKGRAHKLPDASLCEACHKDDAHEISRVLATVPERPHGEIGFNHDAHLAMGPIAGQCVPCHA